MERERTGWIGEEQNETEGKKKNEGRKERKIRKEGRK